MTPCRSNDSALADALTPRASLRKKQARQKIEAPKEPTEAKVINFMDALRRSVDAERGGGGARKSERQRHASPRAPKKAARSSARKRAS
jgi:non-homologous end joining protein Ku